MSDYVHFEITFLELAVSKDGRRSENLRGNCQLAILSKAHILLLLAFVSKSGGAYFPPDSNSPVHIFSSVNVRVRKYLSTTVSNSGEVHTRSLQNIYHACFFTHTVLECLPFTSCSLLTLLFQNILK